MNKIELSIRFAYDKDLPFIFATWLHSYKHSSYFAKKISGPVFFRAHHEVIEDILARDTATAIVANPKDDPDLILGFFVYEPGIAHYVYVKGSFRDFGISRALAEHSKLNLEECSFTHWCFDTDWILEKHPKLIYNPYKGGSYGKA